LTFKTANATRTAFFEINIPITLAPVEARLEALNPLLVDILREGIKDKNFDV
jgi:hypothetical protein